jgi:hypothetical protein
MAARSVSLLAKSAKSKHARANQQAFVVIVCIRLELFLRAGEILTPRAAAKILSLVFVRQKRKSGVEQKWRRLTPHFRSGAAGFGIKSCHCVAANLY